MRQYPWGDAVKAMTAAVVIMLRMSVHGQTAAPSPNAPGQTNNQNSEVNATNTQTNGGQLEQVTVTGYLIPRVGEGPQPVETLTHDFITKQAYQSVNDVLNNYPGGISQQNALTFAGNSNSPLLLRLGLKRCQPMPPWSSVTVTGIQTIRSPSIALRLSLTLTLSLWPPLIALKFLRMAAARRTAMNNYSQFGSAEKPKIAVLYKPFDDFTFRATYSEGFVVPTLGQLFTTPLQFQQTVFDPLKGITQNVLVQNGGNSHLKPENSYGYYLEGVWSPGSKDDNSWWHWAKGFTAYAGITFNYVGSELDFINSDNGTVPAASAGLNPPGYVHLLGNLTLTFGMKNVFDTRPPLAVQANGAQGYDPEVANPIQLFFYGQIEKKF
jgi:outer membrane receptor protein involved in Fe transport